MKNVTHILSAIEDGDPSAAEQLLPLVYDELRRLAAQRLAREQPGQTLEATALVHEAFLRLQGRHGGSWESRAHFYAFASRAMRHILVDHAGRHRAEKRVGNPVLLPLDEAVHAPGSPAADVLGVNDALEQLADRSPRMAQVVELRYFGGLTVTEAAAVLGTSVRTIEREWTRARAYLLEALR